MGLKTMFKPVLFSEIKDYNFQKFRADFFAGLTVVVLAIPLSMAFAIACGLPPEKGLFTSMIAGFFAALFGGSNVQVTGLTGAFVIIIVPILEKFGLSGLITATLIAGVMLLILGALKMGALMRFIPYPVIVGFTSGIAVVIFSTQLRDILGFPIELHIPAEFFSRMTALFKNLSQANLWSVLLCGITVGSILLFKRFLPKFPAMLMGMLVGILVDHVFQLQVETIGGRFNKIASDLPAFAIPALDFATVQSLMLPAFTIAMLAGIESLLCATVADGMTGFRHRPNTELSAQGIANMASALFGGLPATGAICRTATNINSGAKTPVASIIHTLILFVLVVFCASWTEIIPLAALGGILTVVCYNMFDHHSFTRIFKGPKSDFGVMLLTFALTVCVDLVVAVMVGVVLAALLFIRRMAEISDVKAITEEIKEEIKEDDSESPQPHLPDDTDNKNIPPGVQVFEVNGPFFFGAIDRFKNLIFDYLSKKNLPKVMVLRMRHVSVIDATALDVLEDLAQQCAKANIALVLSGVKQQPFNALEKYGITKQLGEKNVCRNIDSALERVNEILAEQSSAIKS